MKSPPPNFWKPIGSLTPDDVKTLLGQPERSIVDYKQARNPKDINPEALGDDLCAFANAGLGRLVIGAEEGDGDEVARFSGMPGSLVKVYRSKIRNAAHTVQPPVNVEIQTVEISSDEFVLVAEIRPAAYGGPHQHRGRYLTRSVDGNAPMTHSSVVQAVLADRGESSTAYSPPSDGFGTPSPFGSTGSAGWFFGVQIAFGHTPTLPVFEVFDEIGERLRTQIGLLAGGGEPAVELNRILIDATFRDGPALRRRVQITTDGCASIFCRLRNDPVDADALIDKTARTDIVHLAQLLSEATPAALVTVRLRIWTSSAEPLFFTVEDDVFALRPGVSYSDRISRVCLLSELDHPRSPLLEGFLSRTRKRLPIFANAAE